MNLHLRLVKQRRWCCPKPEKHCSKFCMQDYSCSKMDSLIQIQSTLRTPVLFLLSVTFWIEMIVLYLPDLKQKSLGKERRVSKFSQIFDASTAQHGEIQTF